MVSLHISGSGRSRNRRIIVPWLRSLRISVLFSFDNVRGSLAGFFTPSFMSSLNVPGLHLHFLSEDRSHGGHLLECVPNKARVGIQFIHNLELSLPVSP